MPRIMERLDNSEQKQEQADRIYDKLASVLRDIERAELEVLRNLYDRVVVEPVARDLRGTKRKIHHIIADMCEELIEKRIAESDSPRRSVDEVTKSRFRIIKERFSDLFE